MNKGWIRIHRQLQDSEIWMQSQPFDMRSAWIDLLLLANHEDKTIIFDYQPFVIKRGQYLTSVRSLSNRWKWSKDRVLKFLRLLTQLQMITKDSNNQRTLLTIENYDKFQGSQDTEQDTGTDTSSYTERTQNGHGFATNKNVKNEEEDIYIRTFAKPTVDEVKAYCQQQGYDIDPIAFVNFYESKGWMIGKNKMKSWKAATATWNRKNKERNKEQPKKASKGMITHGYDFDALEDEI